MAACYRCKSKALTTVEHTEETVCSSCGSIQPFTNFQHHIGGATGEKGTYHRIDDSSSVYKDRKVYESKQLIDDIGFRLNLGEFRTRDVKVMVNKITEGEFGTGDWFNVLVGACCVIIMRRNNCVMTLNEVCAVVDSDLYELGRMVSRVVDFLGLELPELDVVALLERTIRGFSGFGDVGEDKVEEMVKQGNFVVQCCIKWYLTTGRRPGPVVVAVLVFVAGLNGIKVRIEDVAKEVNVGVSTCRLRYKELLEALVEVAQGLPWGKDLNVKNIVRNGKLVMKYMEMKSMESRNSSKRKGFDEESDGVGFEGVLGEYVSTDVGYGIDSDGSVVDASVSCSYDPRGQKAKEKDLVDRNGESALDDILGNFWGDGGCVESGTERYTDELVPSTKRVMSVDELKDLTVAHEEVAKLYSKFKADVASRKSTIAYECNQINEKLDFEIFDEWWSGRSALCEKLLLEELEEKDVGWEALPPSYIHGCLRVKRRREKIAAAKMRINSILHPPIDISNKKVCCSGLEIQSHKGGDCTSKTVNRHKKRKKQHDALDWEDFIIETLLLHKVKEEEIEKGHYKALLGLHVFNTCVV